MLSAFPRRLTLPLYARYNLTCFVVTGTAATVANATRVSSPYVRYATPIPMVSKVSVLSSPAYPLLQQSRALISLILSMPGEQWALCGCGLGQAVRGQARLVGHCAARCARPRYRPSHCITTGKGPQTLDYHPVRRRALMIRRARCTESPLIPPPAHIVQKT